MSFKKRNVKISDFVSQISLGGLRVLRRAKKVFGSREEYQTCRFAQSLICHSTFLVLKLLLLLCMFMALLFNSQEHNGRVFRLQFDDFQIVSSSHDDTILMWDFLNYTPDQNGKGTVTTLR